MQLTMTGEYAIRAMLHLAGENSNNNVQIQDVSKKWDIPENFLRKIIPLLAKAGLIATVRGSGGGIKLGRSSVNISVLEIIEAVEGKIFLNKCLFSDAYCNRSDWCSMHEVWEQIQKNMKSILDSKKISELADINIKRLKNVK